jgi:RimJ/RimL family protein N-acetyltransferase
MLEGKKVRLVPLERRHLERLKNWRNDPAVRRSHFSFMPCTDLGQEIWFERMIRDGRAVYFVIEEKAGAGGEGGGSAIGYCAISEIDWKKRRGVSSIFIGEESRRGLGIGLESLYLLFDYCFGEMGLHKITIYMFSDNERSINLHGKFARVEGTLASHEFQDGAWKDVVVMGLTEEMFVSTVKDKIEKLLK